MQAAISRTTLGGVPAGLLALFVFSDSYKQITLNFTPIDLTLLLAVLLTAICLSNFLIRGTSKNLLVLLGAVIILLLPQALWTNFNEYGFKKLYLFFTVTILAGIAPSLVLRTERNALSFYNAILILALCVGLGYYISPPQLANEDYSGAATISVGRLTGFAAAICFVRFFDKRHALLWIVLFVLLLFFTLSTGNRQSIVALACAIFFSLLLMSRSVHNLRNIFLSFALIVPLGYFALINFTDILPEGSLDRVTTFLSGKENVFDESRGTLYTIAFRNISVFGHGWGYFSTINSVDNYPHNILLELLVEYGLVTAISLMALIAALCFRAWVVYKKIPAANSELRRANILTFMGLVFYFVAANFSGDLNSNKALLCFLFLACILPWQSRAELKHE
ncbi:MAG: O-antigen ligase family protein [Pigmentiphaga sp.]|uniref:O-antigen ligase family protein n=1 Tax=Pigmentiphaga sp. TaxID=1977564 RepID=UPI003B552279